MKKLKKSGRKFVLEVKPPAGYKAISWVKERRPQKGPPVYDVYVVARNGNQLSHTNQGYNRPIKAIRRAREDNPRYPIVKLRHNGKQTLVKKF